MRELRYRRRVTLADPRTDESVASIYFDRDAFFYVPGYVSANLERYVREQRDELCQPQFVLFAVNCDARLPCWPLARDCYAIILNPRDASGTIVHAGTRRHVLISNDYDVL